MLYVLLRAREAFASTEDGSTFEGVPPSYVDAQDGTQRFGGAPPPPPAELRYVSPEKYNENGEPYLVQWGNNEKWTFGDWVNKLSLPGAIPRGSNPRDWAAAELGYMVKKHGNNFPIVANQDDANHLSTWGGGSIGYTESLSAGNKIAAGIVALTIPGVGTAVAGAYAIEDRLIGPPPLPPPGL